MLVFNNFFNSLDLFILGTVGSAICILGMVVYVNDPKNTVHKSFFWLCLATIAYLIFNNVSSKISISFTASDSFLALLVIRFTIFFAIWHVISLFYFCYFFSKLDFLSKYWNRVISFGGVFFSLLLLTPLSFDIVTSADGRSLILSSGPIMPVFGILTFIFSVFSVWLVVRKMKASKEKKTYYFLLFGICLEFFSFIIFNFIFPVAFRDLSFIPFAPLFVVPFILFSTYAIMRHGLLNVKVLSSEILVFFLSIATLVQIFFSASSLEVVLRMSIFILVVIFGLRLIQSTQHEVEQRQKIEQIAKDLAVANEHLRELDKEKSEFVSIASHQLRTPLTAISGYASMLLEGSYGKLSKKVEEAVSRIYQSSGRLVLIIEDFLDITKIEQGRMSYQFTTVDMKTLLRGLVDEMTPSAQEKNLELVFDAGDRGSYNATADFGKIRQVMSNLIDNAIKYSLTGKIDITLSRDSARGKIRVSVRDTGIGISPQTMEKLFQKFSRAEGVKKLYTEGSGLGLYVAQEMMKAHHGRIWVESEGEGKGSTFQVELMAED